MKDNWKTRLYEIEGENGINKPLEKFIETLLAEERNRIIDIAVKRAEEWQEQGFEIDTLIDGLEIIKLEEDPEWKPVT